MKESSNKDKKKPIDALESMIWNFILKNTISRGIALETGRDFPLAGVWAAWADYELIEYNRKNIM